jgi:hypothetical protein
VGRASNRKKAQRQSGLSSRQARQQSRADAATQQAMQVIAAGMQALAQETKGRQDRRAAARRAWCGGAGVVPAKAPRWAKDAATATPCGTLSRPGPFGPPTSFR